MANALWTEAEVRAEGQIGGRSTVRRWVMKAYMPAPIFIGPNSKRWRDADMQEFLTDPPAWRAAHGTPLPSEKVTPPSDDDGVLLEAAE